MQFLTSVRLPDFPQKISLQSQILTLGSCFSENIGAKLETYKFQVLANPFGIIFNPLSIFTVLEKTLNYTNFEGSKIIQNQEIWAHYDVHSRLSDLSQEKLLNNLQKAQQNTFDWFAKIDKNPSENFLILTFGTAYIHRLKSSGEVVANCHKMPTHLFEKKLLSVSEIIGNFEKIASLLFRKKLTIILTVSPVRHIKEGLSENSISKSILRVACHELSEKFSNIYYFPSYELVLDELRDYRFYTADLIHPNEIAITYIFEKFSESFFAESAKNFVKKWQKIQRGLSHNPQFNYTKSHQNFLKKLLGKVQNIKEVDTLEECRFLEKQLELLKLEG